MTDLRELDVGMPRVFICEKDMPAWNARNSSGDKSPRMLSRAFEGIDSWIKFWERITRTHRSRCSFLVCETSLHPTGPEYGNGGHIWIQQEGGQKQEYCYIAPICKSCNRVKKNKQGSGSKLRKGTLVVRIRKPDCMEELNEEMGKFSCSDMPSAPVNRDDL